VAVSEGLFRRLNTSEVKGVIAHEISHIRNNDMRSMWFAMMLSRVTDTLSFIGQILIFINMPLLLFGHVQIAWLPIWLMVFAPVLSYVFQLTLSRVNEYNADLGSAELLGTPDPLISALTKIDQSEGGFIKSLFPGRPRTDDSSIFRTHPPTEERIRRLRELRGTDRPKWYNRNEFFTGHA
jgi:heat shock protein HtpX